MAQGQLVTYDIWGKHETSTSQASFSSTGPCTTAFDYPTVEALSEKVWRDLGGGAEVGPESEEETGEAEPAMRGVVRAPLDGRAAAAAVTVLVTGCSCVTPTPRSRRGVSAASDRPPSGDSVSGVPLERWHTERCRDDYFEGFEASSNMMTGFGGFTENMDLFDAALFGVSRVEAAVMDPQHRSLLEGMLHARASTSLATRGADPLDAPGCGVYVGISSSDCKARRHLPRQCGHFAVRTTPPIRCGHLPKEQARYHPCQCGGRFYHR
jgi:hypothetical protein